MEETNTFDLSHWVDARMAVLAPSNHWHPDVAIGLAHLRGHTDHRNKSMHKWIWAGVGCVVLALCFAALPESRVLAYRCLDCSVALWKDLAGSAPAHANLKPESERKPAIDFTQNDAAGTPVRLSDLHGKVVLLNFWATWCGGCQAEIPWFTEFETKYKDNGFSALGVSLDSDGWKSVKPYVKQKGVNYSIVIGNGELADQYRVSAMPVTVLIDRKGRVAATHVGLVAKEDYRAEIETLLREPIQKP